MLQGKYTELDDSGVMVETSKLRLVNRSGTKIFATELLGLVFPTPVLGTSSRTGIESNFSKGQDEGETKKPAKAALDPVKLEAVQSESIFFMAWK